MTVSNTQQESVSNTSFALVTSVNEWGDDTLMKTATMYVPDETIGIRDANYTMVLERNMDVKTDGEVLSDEITFHLQLNHYLGFWKRLYYGVKYILGMKVSRYHFAEVAIKYKTFGEIKNTMDLFE